MQIYRSAVLSRSLAVPCIAQPWRCSAVQSWKTIKISCVLCCNLKGF
jgi:hypothetical protein